MKTTSNLDLLARAIAIAIDALDLPDATSVQRGAAIVLRHLLRDVQRELKEQS